MLGGSLEIPYLFDEMHKPAAKLRAAGAEFLMLKPKVDQISPIFLDFVQVLSDKHGLKIFFHPAERDTNGTWFAANDDKHQEILANSYYPLIQATKDYGFHPLLVLHLGRLWLGPGETINGKDFASPGDVAFKTAKFLQMLEAIVGEVYKCAHENFTFAIENLPLPGTNKDEGSWGHTAWQLDAFVKHFGRGYEKGHYAANVKVCIDAGHYELRAKPNRPSAFGGSDISAMQAFFEFFKRQYAQLIESTQLQHLFKHTACTHLHGNDGTDDQHELPYKDNVHLPGIRKLLKNKEIIHIVELSPDVLDRTSPAELRRVFDSIGRGRLPTRPQPTKQAVNSCLANPRKVA